ncbi:MAG: ankyrin repeat domain-containing protein [Candidatus Aminicenantes bacterium]|nr:ankyrin repeat domain-containing protein [Candidatus Aminicenantes bacterium]
MKKSVMTALAALLILFVPLSRSLRGSEDLGAVFESGDTAKILEMLAADPQLLKADLGAGMTPLHYGVYYGYVPVVDYALKNGVDLNLKDKRGLSPVWFSVSGSRPAMLRKLISLGADLSVKNAEGDNMLFRAARAGNAEVLGILLDHGFKIDEKNAHGMTLLDYALDAGAVDVIKLLVAKGLDLKSSPDSGLSLLHRAVFSGKADAIHYLLDNGFDVNVKNPDEATPLLLAADFGNRDGARALAMRGADVNAADKNGMTPLSVAVKKGDKDLVDLFLKKGADMGLVDSRTGKTMLYEAALRGYSGVVETLLAHGIEKNVKDKNGFTALSYALKYGNKTAADILRKNGVEETAWAANPDDAAYLDKPLKKGEAYVWYLKHSGWAIKTKSAVLVFDYWDNDPAPDEKLLANGHIRPEELKGYPVYVFVSHEHGDHFDPQILEWRKTIPNITFIFGFEPEDKEGFVSLGPRVQKTIGPLAITTIKANDAGVGFAVEVDGLTIFHAGDHSNNKLEVADNDFFPEIDFLAQKGIRPDISFFLNMYGCGSTNPEAFQKGIFYAVDKLKIKSVLPMHGFNKEWVYGNLVEGVEKNKVKVQVGAAVNQGDRFFFQKGRLIR